MERYRGRYLLLEVGCSETFLALPSTEPHKIPGREGTDGGEELEWNKRREERG